MQPVEVPAGLRDLAHERQRLTQQLNDRARYDPAALAQLAALCFEMHDLFHAGRLWLFSDATGDSVEPVVDYFADRCGRKPRSILSQVPAYVLQPDLETYPAVVRDRLARVGISESDLRERITPPASLPRSSRWTLVAPSLLLAYALLCFILGAMASFRLAWNLVQWIL